MNKKGFTLIELLAVIVILALVAVIATPIVLNIINSTKEQALKRSAELYIDAVNNALANNRLTSEIEISDGKYSLSEDGDICLNSDCTQVLKINISGDKPVKYKSSIEFENITAKYYTINYGDNKGYVIKDENGITVQLGELVPSTLLPGLVVAYNADLSSNIYLDNPFNITRSQIKSIKFEKTNKVPEEYKEQCWDVSETKNGSVMAWHTGKDSNGLYELYIGGKNGVTANSFSARLFSYLTSAVSIDASELDTSEVTNMDHMFGYSSKLSDLNISNWDTSKVENTWRMFIDCSSITSLDLNSWDMSSATNISFMFYKCTKLANLNISSWDTSKVTTMNSMFTFCPLTSLDINGWNTSNVTNMGSMFSWCQQLTTLDLSNWNTGKVTTMENMFSLSRITNLYLTNFIIKDKSVKLNYIFKQSRITNIDLSNATIQDMTNLTNSTDMFYGISQENITVKNNETMNWLATKCGTNCVITTAS